MKTLSKRLQTGLSLFAAFALLSASLAPMLFVGKSSAAQITSRSIAISSSKVSLTDVTYTVNFTTATTNTIQGIVIDFCDNSPLVGVTCNAPAGFDTKATTTLALGSLTGISGFTIDTTNSTANKVILTNGSGGSVNASTAVIIPLGTAAANDGLTNPSATGTFYARILTFATVAGATGYTSTVPGTHVDEGGVALSTANQLTTTARVQEQLQFCVGGTTVNDATTSITTDCATAFTGAGSCGNAVDLGVIDSSAIYSSPVSATTQGNDCNGAAMVRTNANNGVVISYYAEQAGTGSNHLGSLRVTGATCTADANPSTSTTDQCINSMGTTQASLTAGTEKFGLTVGGVNCGSTTAYTCTYATGTYNLVRNATYDGTGANTYDTPGNVSNQYAWQEDGTASTLASSTGVVDDEALVLRFAAAAGATTPTGTYSVKSTYIATATY